MAHYKEAEIQELLKSQRPRSHSFKLFYLLFPYFLFVSIGLHFLRFLMPRQGKILISKFLRHYFKLYFMIKGITFGFVRELPQKTVHRPQLILGIRQHIFGSLLTYTMFDYPLIVPLEKLFHRYRTFRFFSISVYGAVF